MGSGVAAEFVENLCQIPLLEEAQVEELRTTMRSRFAAPRDLAQELMRRGWLTPYQINQIFQGHGDELIFGPYVFLERLGEGGMGQVFKARQRNLGRVVALKVIRRDYLHDSRAVPRFQREMHVISQLSHPNIVQAYDSGQIEGVYFIAMEYIDGLDLSRLIKQSGPLPVPMACDYVRQIALGLQHAHEQGLVHRDIKPANMLVPHANLKSGGESSSAIRLLSKPAGEYPWGQIKILDLGLARCLNLDADSPIGNLTQMGVVVGTPDFIAPEQARSSHACDIRSDLYSLGCTFYYLLAGRVPFPHGTLTEKLLHHQLDEAEPIAKVREYKLMGQRPGKLQLRRDFLEVPAEVAVIVARLMAKKPEQRFQAPWELAAALEFQSSQPSKPAPASPWAEVKSRSRSVPLPSLTLPEQPLPAKPPAKTPIPVGILIKDSERLPVSATPPSLDQTEIPRPPVKTWRWRKYWPAAVGIAVATALMVAIIFLGRAARDRRQPPLSGNKPQTQDQPLPVEAEAEWKKLQAQLAQDATGQKVGLRRKLLAFRQKFVASPQAQEAGDWLIRLPSVLSQLNPKELPPNFKADNLVAVLGEVNPPRERINRTLCVAMSPDCAHVVAGCDDQVIRIWDPVQDKEIHLPRQAGPVDHLAFSPAGQLLASGSSDGVQIWDAPQKKHLFSLENQKRSVAALTFAPNGQYLATADLNGQIRLWDPRTGKVQTSLMTKVVQGKPCLAFADDGRTLFWSGTDRLIHWRHLEGEAAGNESSYALGFVSAMAFQPQGKTMACATPDGVIHVLDWDGSGLRQRSTLKEPTADEDEPTGRIFALAFSPDGKTLVATGTNSAWLWDLASGQPTFRLKVRGAFIRSSSLASDGRHLAVIYGTSNVFLFRLPPSSP